MSTMKTTSGRKSGEIGLHEVDEDHFYIITDETGLHEQDEDHSGGKSGEIGLHEVDEDHFYINF
ncbi:hypothetical protein UACE39S_04095 [Ureibacillus acetophenoni]